MKLLTGIITSNKMAKTATVSVTRFMSHPLYKKRIKRTEKYQVHDEVGHKVGEMVTFVACAPISKLKKWKIVEVGVTASPVSKAPKSMKVAKTPVKVEKKAVKKPTKVVKKTVKKNA